MSERERYLELDENEAPLALRLRIATDETQPAVVMLHGLTGDQHSMWSLEAAAPPGALVVTPRGPYPQEQGGYAWNPSIRAWPPLLSEFAASVETLERLLEFLERRFAFSRASYVLMGFSNGAAMTFAAGMTPLEFPPLGLVAMSGHLPEGQLEPLRDLPVFWSHGIRDTFIPISVARDDVSRLRATGCRVELCEADVGHKLAAGCLDELRSWYRARVIRSTEKSS